MVRFVLGRNVDMEDVDIRTIEFQTIDGDVISLEHELERGWKLMGVEVVEKPEERYPETLKEATAKKVSSYLDLREKSHHGRLV